VPGPYPATRRSRRRRSAAGAVAPRPWARGWRRATPGWPGLCLTRSVGELDRNPNTLLDGLVGDNSFAVAAVVGVTVALRRDLCRAHPLQLPLARLRAGG
jgi:hypothetical protein